MSRPASKDRYHHGELRKALVDAALALVGEGGTGALSLREVARRVGVSHAAPKHHFPDKAALLAAVGARAFADLADSMQRATAAAGDDATAQLKASGVAYVRYAVQHPALFRLLFGGELSLATDPELDAQSRRAFEVLVRSATAAAGKDASAGDVELLVTSAWSVVHGLSLLWLDGHLGSKAGRRGDAEIARLATRVTDFLARALASQ